MGQWNNLPNNSGARALRVGLKFTAGPNAGMNLELGRREHPVEAPEYAMQLNGMLRCGIMEFGLFIAHS